MECINYSPLNTPHSCDLKALKLYSVRSYKRACLLADSGHVSNCHCMQKAKVDVGGEYMTFCEQMPCGKKFCRMAMKTKYGWRNEMAVKTFIKEVGGFRAESICSRIN